ncbi:MAG: hypothetical protein QGG05_20320 [Candidatus Latescibacteria bacterium]|jgi:hypothetical protein|nr:hypothetical protein [Candidatus Latescibacterota bacterium]
MQLSRRDAELASVVDGSRGFLALDPTRHVSFAILPLEQHVTRRGFE